MSTMTLSSMTTLSPSTFAPSTTPAPTTGPLRSDSASCARTRSSGPPGCG